MSKIEKRIGLVFTVIMMFAIPYLVEQKLLIVVINVFGWMMFMLWRFAYDDLQQKFKGKDNCCYTIL